MLHGAATDQVLQFKLTKSGIPAAHQHKLVREAVCSLLCCTQLCRDYVCAHDFLRSPLLALLLHPNVCV